MAEKRMFATSVVETDSFYELSIGAQALYFHLSMAARNKGLLNNARTIARVIGADLSCIDELIEHKYIAPEEDGVFRIIHWYENNTIGENHKKRNSYSYRKWRAAVIARDKVCQSCGSTKNLEAHHIKPFATHPELRLDVNNGITLCRECHRGW